MPGPRGKRQRVLTPERAHLAELHLDVARRAVRNVIKRKNLPMHKWPGVEWDDAFSVGNEALCEAAADWNVAGGEFEPFAFQRVWFRVIDWIRNDGGYYRGMTDGVREMKRKPRMMSWVDDFETDYSDTGPPTEALLRDEDLQPGHADILAGRAFVAYAFSLLSPREREVMFELLIVGRTLDSVAREIGVTESRICQIRSSALHKLRRNGDVIRTAA